MSLNLFLCLHLPLLSLASNGLSDCFTQDISWDDASSTIKQVFSALECHTICQNSSSCSTFSWSPTSTCKLFPQPTFPVPCQDCISGSRVCSKEKLNTNYPLCFSPGTSWEDNMLETIVDVTSVYDCQELCQATNHFSAECVQFTWFGPEATPYRNTCELYPHIAHKTECTNCFSGPKSCTCSSDHECSLHNDVMVDIYESVVNEADCQDICGRNSECHFYSWFDSSGSPFQDACILLTACEESDITLQGCHSGPESCEAVTPLPNYPNTISSPNYPNNYDPNLNINWVATASKHTEKIELQFIDFYTEGGSYDHVIVTDGDGTQLMDHTGNSLPDPPFIRSKTDTVTINFSTDGSGHFKGFLLKWRVIY